MEEVHEAHPCDSNEKPHQIGRLVAQHGAGLGEQGSVLLAMSDQSEEVPLWSHVPGHG